MIEIILFIFFALIALASAVVMITRANPVISAIFLIINFFALAGLYLVLNAQFIAVLQILVYAGAIMVLFVFVIMLLNLGDEEALIDKFNLKRIIAISIGAVIFLQLAYIILVKGNPVISIPQSIHSVEAGKVESIGIELFTTYLIPFEIISMLLIAAIIGAVVLAKRELE
jgi:NADH-quinone oxidoreductase subunit J